jgi:hypothetical protein
LKHQNRSSALLSDDDIDLEAGGKRAILEVPLEKRKARLSLTKRAQMMLIRKQMRRWHAALAGAVAGGLAIMWEKRTRRGLIAQQMFVRCVLFFFSFFFVLL